MDNVDYVVQGEKIRKEQYSFGIITTFNELLKQLSRLLAETARVDKEKSYVEWGTTKRISFFILF